MPQPILSITRKAAVALALVGAFSCGGETGSENAKGTSKILTEKCSDLPDSIAYEAKICRALTYAADREGKELKLDLYLPNEFDTETPLVVRFYGGGWVSGGRGSCDPEGRGGYHQELLDLVGKYRFALACVSTHIAYLPGVTEEAQANQRTPDEAALSFAGFRTQIADAKASVRWLRENWPRARWNDWREKPIGALGDSAGATIAINLGLTGDLRPDILEYPGQDLSIPSTVQAVISLWGVLDFDPTRFQNISDDIWLDPYPEDRDFADPSMLVKSRPAGAVKLLLLQGLSDPIVSTEQARGFRDTYLEKLRREAPALYASRDAYVTLIEAEGGHEDWNAVGENMQVFGAFMMRALVSRLKMEAPER